MFCKNRTRKKNLDQPCSGELSGELLTSALVIEKQLKTEREQSFEISDVNGGELRG